MSSGCMWNVNHMFSKWNESNTELLALTSVAEGKLNMGALNQD